MHITHNMLSFQLQLKLRTSCMTTNNSRVHMSIFNYLQICHKFTRASLAAVNNNICPYSLYSTICSKWNPWKQVVLNLITACPGSFQASQNALIDLCHYGSKPILKKNLWLHSINHETAFHYFMVGTIAFSNNKYFSFKIFIMECFTSAT